MNYVAQIMVPAFGDYGLIQNNKVSLKLMNDGDISSLSKHSRKEWLAPLIFLLFPSVKNIKSRGGGFSAKFRIGVCRPRFQNGTVG